MVGLGVDSVGLATTLLEHTMVTKGVLVVNNSVMDPESGGTEVSLLPGHFKNIFFLHLLLKIFVLSTVKS